MTRLSVIIPGYNSPDAYWKRCLDSVIAACGPDDEIICVDDGSKIKPSAVNLDLQPQPQIKWIFLEKNQGQSAARNRALDVAQGEWVTFVDSDDAVYPDVYAKCFETINENPTADIALFGVRGIWMREKMTRFDMPKSEWLGVLNATSARKLYDARLFEYPVNKLYRRSFLEANKIRFLAGICPGEDSIFNLTCATAGAKWCTVATVGYKYYRMDGTSLSRYLPRRAESLSKKSDCWQAFVDKYGDTEELLLDLRIFNERNWASTVWHNIWRKGSPYSLLDRMKWLRKNERHFKFPIIITFCRKFILNIVRQYFYFGWVYKLHIKRFYHDFVSFKQEEDL